MAVVRRHRHRRRLCLVAHELVDRRSVRRLHRAQREVDHVGTIQRGTHRRPRGTFAADDRRLDVWRRRPGPLPRLTGRSVTRTLCVAVTGAVTPAYSIRSPMTRRVPAILALAALAASSFRLRAARARGSGPDRPEGDRHRGAQVRPRPPRASTSTSRSTARPRSTLPGAGAAGDADRPDRDDRRRPTSTSRSRPPRRPSTSRRCSNLAGEVIAVDGKAYLKTTLTGPLVPGVGSAGRRRSIPRTRAA